MDTSLERIRAKIAELEAKIADLRIAERENPGARKASLADGKTWTGAKAKTQAGGKQPGGRRARPPARRSLTFSASRAPFRPPRSPSISGRQAEISTIEPYPFRCNR